MGEEVVNLYDLEKKVEDAIQDKEGWEYKKDSLRISEIPYCHRKSYIYRKFNITPRLNGKMLSGTMFHDRLGTILKKIPDFKNAEFEVPCEADLGEFKLRGRADVVEGNRVFEFKYSAARLKGNLPAYYMIQSNAYANMLGKEKYVLSFVSSYSLKPVLMEFKADRELYEATLEDARKLFKSIQENEFPDGPKWEWECKNCGVKSKCKELRELQEYKDLPEMGIMP